VDSKQSYHLADCLQSLPDLTYTLHNIVTDLWEQSAALSQAFEAISDYNIANISQADYHSAMKSAVENMHQAQYRLGTVYCPHLSDLHHRIVDISIRQAQEAANDNG